MALYNDFSDENALKVIAKVRITSVGILNICNLWILLRKIVIYLVENSMFIDFLLSKLTEF